MIQVTLKAHVTLKRFFGPNNLIISMPDGSTVGEALDRAFVRFQEDLEQKYGLERSRELMQHAILLVNGKLYTQPDDVRTQVRAGDQIEIMVTFAGG